MQRSTVRNIVAIVVIFGHLGVFLAALSLGIFSLLQGIDAIQTLLMASPVLAATALAAFSSIIEQKAQVENDKVTAIFVILCTTFPVILIIVIFSVFYLFYSQLDHFGPDQLKISLGGIETFFAAFIGAISKSLFGGQSKQA